VKWLLLRKPEELRAQDETYRQTLFRLSPRLSSLSALGQDFVRLVRERKSKALLPWLERAKGCPYEELRRFAQGLEREFPAVQAALDSPLEYWAGRRADYQAQIAQTSDVWASPYRSVTFVGAPCGLTSLCKGTRDAGLREEVLPEQALTLLFPAW
jgi:hypothetical protein